MVRCPSLQVNSLNVTQNNLSLGLKKVWTFRILQIQIYNRGPFVVRSFSDSQEGTFLPPENRSLIEQQSLLLTSAAPVAAGFTLWFDTDTMRHMEAEGQNPTPVKLQAVILTLIEQSPVVSRSFLACSCFHTLFWIDQSERSELSLFSLLINGAFLNQHKSSEGTSVSCVA